MSNIKSKLKAQEEVLNIMQGFNSILLNTDNVNITLSANIKNVKLLDLLSLYLEYQRKGIPARLAAPGEMINDGTYVIIYRITQGIHIYIESEMVQQVTSKLRKINYN